MPDLYKVFSVCLYLLVDYLPYNILAMVPFWHKRRFSVPVTLLLLSLVTVLQVATGYVSVAHSGGGDGILWVGVLLYSVFYFSAVKAHWGKQLFTMLFLSNVSNCIAILAKFLEGLVFGRHYAYINYHLTFSACTFVLEVLGFIPLYFYFKGYYRKGLDKTAGNTSWHYLWLIPATFYLTWMHHVHDSRETMLDIAMKLDHAVFFLAINMGAFLVYHTVVRMINVQEKNMDLERSNHRLNIQTLYHEHLNERINEARRTKHDIRHHIIVMDSYLQNGEYDKAREYLSGYKRSLPDDSKIVFCNHEVINALLLYYAQLAKNHRIDYDVAIADIPKKINLPDTVFTVVLSNLLENAIEACCEPKITDRRITIRGKASGGAVFFRIENTYNGKSIINRKGDYVSSKDSGRGIGVASVRNIIDQYDGIVEINGDNGIFSVALFLNIPTEEAGDEDGDKA